jgi:hypothetical protein
MTSDDAFDQTWMSQVIEASLLPIALPGRIDERQVGWASLGEKTSFESCGESFRMTGSDKPSGSHRNTVLNQLNRLFG